MYFLFLFFHVSFVWYFISFLGMTVFLLITKLFTYFRVENKVLPRTGASWWQRQSENVNERDNFKQNNLLSKWFLFILWSIVSTGQIIKYRLLQKLPSSFKFRMVNACDESKLKSHTSASRNGDITLSLSPWSLMYFLLWCAQLNAIPVSLIWKYLHHQTSLYVHTVCTGLWVDDYGYGVFEFGVFLHWVK